MYTVGQTVIAENNMPLEDNDYAPDLANSIRNKKYRGAGR